MSLEPSLTRARGSRPIGPSLTRARGSRPIGPSLAPAVLSLLACFAFSVCGATAGDGIGEAKGGDESGRRDALGFPLKPGPPPRAIVSLSPNLTEMLFALGVRQERIAGVTRFCDYPEEARALPRIGGIVDPSVEGILAVGPDL
ncbi:MAG: hypothetical protein FJY88_12365, partial [Candidatus Eisenbacteria bacterium]|nr:hypothetical protein [Candidatus Eisenbacteria bacterium]